MWLILQPQKDSWVTDNIKWWSEQHKYSSETKSNASLTQYNKTHMIWNDYLWYQRYSLLQQQHYCINKKFELMLMRHVKAYSSSCSHTLSLSPAISSQFILRVCTAAKNSKNKFLKNPYFGSSGSFKVINVNRTEKLITSACCDRQHAHAHAHLQPFSWKTGQQW